MIKSRFLELEDGYHITMALAVKIRPEANRIISRRFACSQLVVPVSIIGCRYSLEELELISAEVL